MIVGCLILNSCSLDAHQLKSLEHLITKKQAMNTKLKKQNQLLFEIDFSKNSNDFDFKEWASEVRKQMIASLEQRHTKRAKK
jgi:hypothetical protein